MEAMSSNSDDLKADANYKDENDSTALHYAS